MEVNKIIHADVFEGLKQIPDNFVDCVITSPPYYGLRDYHIEGQIGLEPTLDDYINNLLKVTAELKRVLKPTGVVFWVHGDSYNGSGKAGSNPEYWERHTEFGKPSRKERFGRPTNLNSIPTKCMVMQPERLAMRMVDEQGWILRNKIVWHKPNHMPESVTDRFTSAYELVFMFTKNKRYWFDLDAVREGIKTDSRIRPFGKRGGNDKINHRIPQSNSEVCNPKGKNPGDTWTMTTEPYPEAHFAVFPKKLAERCIKAGCPEQVCKKCSKPRERIVKRKVLEYMANPYKAETKFIHHGEGKSALNNSPVERYTIGWTDCGCNAGWDKGIVLDPFMGSGTTALVALKNNRNFIGIEINKDYVDMAYRRIKPYLEQERLEKWF